MDKVYSVVKSQDYSMTQIESKVGILLKSCIRRCNNPQGMYILTTEYLVGTSIPLPPPIYLPPATKPRMRATRKSG